MLIGLVLCCLDLAQPPRADLPKGTRPVPLGERIEQLIRRSGREVSGPPVEGVLVGYALRDPERGWAEVRKLIEDPSASFLVRYSGLRATARLRLVAPDVVSEEVELSVLAKLLEQPDMTDLVVERLRKDRNWGLTGAILKLQPLEPYRRPIIQRSIIRYALDCPDGGAKRFVEGMLHRDKDLVDEIKMSRFDGGGDERGGGPPPVIPDGYEVADVLVRPGVNLDEDLRTALGSVYKRVARWRDEKDRTIITEFVWEPKAVRPGEKVRVLIPTMHSAHAVAQAGGRTVWGGPNVRTGQDVLSPEIEVPQAAGGQPPSLLRISVSSTSFVHDGVDNVYILRPKAQKAKETPRKRVGAPSDVVDNSPAAVERAIKRGAATAAADIKAGCPVILYYGKPWSAGKPLVDEGTALPVEIVGGCDVTAAFVAEVAAYNAAIRDWHAKKKRPAPKD